MKCSYCKQKTRNTKICDFCKADLTVPRPKINPMLDDSTTNYTQPQLQLMHTFDLLLILRHVRTERSEMYKTMQNVRKAPKEAKSENYNEINEYGQKLYRDLTAQKNVLEQVLVDRMGYYPRRIDNKLLYRLKRKIDRK